MSRSFRCLSAFALLCSSTVVALAQVPDYARDPHQAIDESYTEAIRKYTTEPQFNSPLTDYLPASKKAMSPARPTCCPTRRMSTNSSACSPPPRRECVS